MSILFKSTLHVLAPFILSAGLLSIVATAPVMAQQPVAASENAVKATPEDIARETLRGETRIRQLHDRLQITAAEETLWKPVADAMRENQTAFRADMARQTSGKASPTAVDELRTFQIIADQHAAGLKKLIPVFDTLYQGLPPAKQKRADRIFGERFGSNRM